MLRIPQLARHLDNVTTPGIENRQLSGITQAWVEGKSIGEIAATYFQSGSHTDALTNACRAIYRTIANNGTWGLSALSRLSGIDFDQLSSDQKRQIDLLPAMIYHGVKTEQGVLMRMNGVPRSIAEKMGESFRDSATAGSERSGIRGVRGFLASADLETWNRARPSGASLSGQQYREIWSVISGEGR